MTVTLHSVSVWEWQFNRIQKTTGYDERGDTLIENAACPVARPTYAQTPEMSSAASNV